MAPKKYYAVAVGKVPGIYTRWFGEGGAEKMVRGFAGAVYKGFATIEEARQFMQDHQGGGKARKARPKKRFSARKPGLHASTRAPEPGQIVMYTDGGALGNPGPGGYGVVIIDGQDRRELSHGYRHTTNNRMELMACIAALRAYEDPQRILLHSDSQYVINGIVKGWAKGWKSRGWKKSNGEPALNRDLWESLLQLCDRHTVDFVWVKGHAGIAENERCDQLAKQAAGGDDLSIDMFFESAT